MNKKIVLFAISAFFLIILGIILFAGGKKKEIQINSKAVEENNIPENNAENIESEKNNSQEALPAESALSAGEEDKVQVEPASSAGEEDKILKEDDSATDVAAPDFKINNKLVSWGFQKSSGRKIDTIIIHSSYNSLGGDEHSMDKILDIYKSYGVAPHYIITREGKIYRLVKDENIAYHAGESEVPDGRTGVNNFSIGIEIINTKSESPSAAQYASLKKLIAYLKNQYKIKYTLGHKDISPGRKDDPWNFNWDKVK